MSVFGSIVEQTLYRDLKQDLSSRFGAADLFLAFSSRMVLKHLDREGTHYGTLPQVLAEVDRAGYRRVVVASINLFPADEHEQLLRIVTGFRTFSPAHIRHTKAIIHKTKETSLMLKDLDATIREPGWANLYIVHGAPVLNLPGLDAVHYADAFLRRIHPHNYTCSLEGAFPWYAIRESLTDQMKHDGITHVQVVPMLLVSGNHYRKDMIEIVQELGRNFAARIVPPQGRSERFNLIELESVRNIIVHNIEEEMTRFGC